MTEFGALLKFLVLNMPLESSIIQIYQIYDCQLKKCLPDKFVSNLLILIGKSFDSCQNLKDVTKWRYMKLSIEKQ